METLDRGLLHAMGESIPQEPFNSAWAHAKVGVMVPPVTGAIGRMSLQPTHGSEIRGAANIEQALAPLSWADGPAAGAMCSAATSKVSCRGPQEPGTAAWTSTTSSALHSSATAALSAQGPLKPSEPQCQNPTNVARPPANAGLRGHAAAGATAAERMREGRDLNSQNASNGVRAFRPVQCASQLLAGST